MALQDEYKNEPGSVIGSDFYGATELLGLSDDEIIQKVVDNIARCDSRVRNAKVSLYTTFIQIYCCTFIICCFAITWYALTTPHCQF